MTEDGACERRRLANLEADLAKHALPEATVGIGQHPVGATNGAPSDNNAHPHLSADGNIAIIHNGIIENANVLKGQLQTEGYSFASSTDSEVAAKLLGKMAEQVIAETGKPDLFEALRRVARQLTGAFTILAGRWTAGSRMWWSRAAMTPRWSSGLATGPKGELPRLGCRVRSWPTPRRRWNWGRTRPSASPPIR